MWKMDPMSGFDIRLVFTLPPRDSTLQYKRCIHLWNNVTCIITLGKRTIWFREHAFPCNWIMFWSSIHLKNCTTVHCFPDICWNILKNRMFRTNDIIRNQLLRHTIQEIKQLIWILNDFVTSGLHKFINLISFNLKLDYQM